MSVSESLIFHAQGGSSHLSIPWLLEHSIYSLFTNWHGGLHLCRLVKVLILCPRG